MRGRWLLVVVVALLAISAQPVAAQNATAVASKHTTFGTGSAGESAPTTLQNMGISGSGESASVVFSGSGYNPVESQGDGGADGFEYAIGANNDKPWQTEIKLRPQSALSAATISVNISSVGGSDYGATVAVYLVQEEPDQVYGEGTQIATWDPDWATGEQTIALDDTIALDADTTYTLELVTQSGSTDLDRLTIATDDSATSTWMTTNADGGIGPDSYNKYADVQVGTGGDNGSYVSAVHDAEAVTTAWTNLTLSNTSATVTWQEDADNDGTWTNVTSTTVSSTTNATQDLSGTTSDRWRVRADFEATGASPVAEIHDEGLLFESSSPILSDSEPPDEMKIQNATGNVSINVSDADFGLAQGESATVSATDDDGTSLGSTTLPSNGTASFSYSSEAGENIIEWTATDAYGNTETFTQTFTTPEMLYIRPEGDPGALVSGPNVSIEVRFYSQDQIYTRTTSDGSVSLAGLPADARFAVVVSAEGYYRRRVIIDSLFEQQSVYLLNESHPAVEKQFVLNDVSANFPADSTRIYIQRSINNSTTYRTVAADYFGATSSFATFLKTDQRYRIIIENDQGDRRTLGSYTPVAAGVEPLKIEGVGLYQESQDGYIANASTRMVTDTQRQVVVRYRDPAAATSDYTVQIYERGNESNVTYTEQVTGPVENYSAYVDVKNNTNYVVNWSATRNGQQIGGVRPVGGGDLGLRIPLPDQWLGTIGLVIIVFVGSLAGERYATHLALSVVAFAGVLMYLAVIDIFLPLWWASLLIAAGGHLAQRRPAA